MSKKSFVACGFIALMVGVAIAAQPADKKAMRSAEMAPRSIPEQMNLKFGSGEGDGLRGTADFRQSLDFVRLELRVDQGPPGVYAVILHEASTCDDPGTSAASAHWNPTDSPHGRWGSQAFHLGDVGNLVVGEDGTGSVVTFTDRWSLGGPAASAVTGKTLVIHARPDDFTTQPDGDVGPPVVCVVVPAR